MCEVIQKSVIQTQVVIRLDTMIEGQTLSLRDICCIDCKAKSENRGGRSWP